MLNNKVRAVQLYKIHYRIKNIKLVKDNYLFHPKRSLEVSKTVKTIKTLRNSCTKQYAERN